MKIMVCIKGVPDTSEAEIKVEGTGKNVRIGDSAIEMNDSDNYALEEAMLIKESTDGSVHVLSAGVNNDEVMMIAMEALAKGSDSAAIIVDPAYDEIRNDPVTVARLLASGIKNQSYDLILTGCIATDDSFTAVGTALAEELGMPHASMVKKVESSDGALRIHRELEDGLSEVVDLTLPAVLTIQTGINKPRYSSVHAIRKARKKERNTYSFADIGFDNSSADNAIRTELKNFYIPELSSDAEIIEGDPETKAEILAQKLINGGIL